MKCILFLSALVFVSIAKGQSGAESDYNPQEQQVPQLQPEVQGMTLPDYIGTIVAQDEISAQDYHNMAQGTMDVAMAVMQSGEKMPEPPLRDALDAVAAGRELDPTIPDWDDIEQRLLDLLNPPPQDQQQQQNQDQQQEGDPSESQENQEGQDGDQQERGEGEQSESENQEGGEQQDQEGQSEDGQKSEQNQDGSQEQQSGEEGGDEEAAEAQQTQDGAQMGELDQDQEEQNVQLDESAGDQESSSEDMQSVGGQQTTGEPVNAETAALKQMLDKLKQQDEPGKLYQILQEAQSGGQKKQQPNAKDW